MRRSQPLRYDEAMSAVLTTVNRPMRQIARELGLDGTTISRISDPSLRAAPAKETHRKLVNYCRSKEMFDEVLLLERAWDNVTRRAESTFERVFGRELARTDAGIVVPLYQLNPAWLRRDEKGVVLDDLDYFVKDGDQSGRLGGIGHGITLAAYHDLLAVLTIQQMLAANAPADGIRIEGDTSFTAPATDLSGLPLTTVLIGLHANRIADAYASLPTSIVQVERPGDGHQGAIIVDGQSFENSGSGKYPLYFVIARVVPDPVANEDRVCIICAGTTGTATWEAARFLREKWMWFAEFPKGDSIAAAYGIDREGSDPELVALAKQS